jgi:ATP-dependent DNA helicase RecG
MINTSIQYLKGIGPKRAESFAGIGVKTIFDLFYYFPRRYEDRTNVVTISKLRLGEIQTVKVKVLISDQHNSWRRRAFNITEVSVGDDTGKLSCVWFNQPYLGRYFKPGNDLILYGKVELYAGKLQMSNPEFEIVSDEEDDSLRIGRFVPVYTLPSGISQRVFRKIVKSALDEYLPKLNDCLPYDLRSRNKLENLAKSLINIHFPENIQLRNSAYTRLAFEEFFIFQIPIILRKLKREEKKGIAHITKGVLLDSFISALPFKLTQAQEKVVGEISLDMAEAKPMQRLLQGDVGSGKTVVATISGIMAIQGGYQVAFMAPTEILARQHYEKIRSQLSAISFKPREIKVELLTGSATEKEKKGVCEKIKEGKIDFVIGTHALLEPLVRFKNLGLVIIDEQHKFGVAQRALLSNKGKNPDVLIMTATPIPRTLAITLYGDLDVSIINQMPPGKLPIRTLLFNRDKINEAYRIAREELKRGNQVYVVYPVIEESSFLDISGAKKMYTELKSKEFRDFKLGLVHGKLKQEEQDRVMSDFKNKKIDLLVSTTILEVGIDIPRATCMIIEHADRFGLSQLHQLRGRVGRGSDASYCFLVSDSQTQEAIFRLEAMFKYSDGFRISEEDLKIRGPGEFFGREQHGLSELRIANPLTQMHLLKKAREEVISLLRTDQGLMSRQNQLLRERLLQKFPEYERLMLIG